MGRDAKPRTGYVLTLQAREQFIRRERATSNVSTAQALIALAFTIAVQALGPQGLRESAELCYQRAHDAAQAASPRFPDTMTRNVVRGSRSSSCAARSPRRNSPLRCRQRGITPGLDVSDRPEPEADDALLFCVTEATPDIHVDALIDALTEIGAEA